MQQPMTPEQVAQKIKEQNSTMTKGGKAKSKAKMPQENLNESTTKINFNQIGE